MEPFVSPLSTSNSAIVLIDHQPGVLAMVQSLPADLVEANAATLARLGETMGLPLVITSTRENLPFLGTTLKKIQEAAPEAYERRIARPGTLNAFQDADFSSAVAATGRRHLVLAGLTTDVCLFHAASTALRLGYGVHIAADACGCATALGDAVTYERLRSMGAVVTTTHGVLFGLYSDLSLPEGQRAEAVASGGGAHNA